MRAAMADKMHGGFDFDAISKSFFIAVGTPDKGGQSARRVVVEDEDDALQ